MSDHGQRAEPAARAATLREARARFYPGWWTHSPIRRPADKLPHYWVLCADEEERRLAEAVKPECVKAEFVLIDGSASKGGMGTNAQPATLP